MYSRRNFLKTSLIGGVAISSSHPVQMLLSAVNPKSLEAQVSLTTGNDRADMAFRALQPFAEQIKNAIGKVIEEGKVKTYDMLKLRGGPDVFKQGACTTPEMTDAVIAAL